MSDNITAEIKDMIKKVDSRRESTMTTAIRKSEFKNSLIFWSGVLAILSAGATTSLLVTFAGANLRQIFAAVTALLSGVLSLQLSKYKDDNISKMYSAASKYLELRDKLKRMLWYDVPNGKNIANQLEQCQNEYAKLDQLYARYFYTAVYNKPRGGRRRGFWARTARVLFRKPKVPRYVREDNQVDADTIN